MSYQANPHRYDRMVYHRTGLSGLKLPAFSLGLWYNFGGVDAYEKGRALVRGAFDLGITHFDLANVYGPPPGSAEEMFGRLLATDLAPYRDELVVATKASGQMFEGPYGGGGSRKTFVAALDRSLQRLGLDYVDIFYAHGLDPEVPLEETMAALDHAVRQGKALYVGICSHDTAQSAEAIRILRELGTPMLIHQHDYSMLNRGNEGALQQMLADNGVGAIVFSPLAQGILTGKYVSGFPDDSRANSPTGHFDKNWVTDATIRKLKRLAEIAERRGQTLPQMALAWLFRDGKVTSAILGASRVEQLAENVAALNGLRFGDDERLTIERILSGEE
ncbi:aldo/keto reductase [Cohnella hongkongensis]|uniref:Aldo/keto reductase n=1 Tax=Cohnella hongkongensis TaxID=178337 RepID=A0ABV9FHY6_9BACL